MYKLIRNIGFLAVLLGLGLVSCDEDYPKSHIAPYDTELLSIKITNAWTPSWAMWARSSMWTPP